MRHRELQSANSLACEAGNPARSRLSGGAFGPHEFSIFAQAPAEIRPQPGLAAPLCNTAVLTGCREMRWSKPAQDWAIPFYRACRDSGAPLPAPEARFAVYAAAPAAAGFEHYGDDV
jgi:hypothetical protein